MDQFLERDIQYLKGVGDKRARLFHKLGIFVVGDLVRYYPRTYEDWSVTTPAAQAPEGTTVCVQATMVTPMRTHLIRKGMTLYKADFTDGETLIHVTLFNTKFLAEKLRMYQDYLLLGKVERNFTTVQMSAPKIEPLTARRIHPIYTQTGSLNANLIAKAVDYALAHMAPLPDTLSPALREKYGLEDLDTAVHNIHFPSNAKALEAARHRLIFEELLTLTVGLKKLKGRKRTPTTRVIEKDCTAAFAGSGPVHCRPAKRLSHEPTTPRGCGQRQNRRGCRSAGHDGAKRLPVRPDGAYGDFSHPALCHTAKILCRYKHPPMPAHRRLHRQGEAAN